MLWGKMRKIMIDFFLSTSTTLKNNSQNSSNPISNESGILSISMISF